ncbi:MAG: hypothetical protein AAF802_12845 [Planctomycetota bacterium]
MSPPQILGLSFVAIVLGAGAATTRVWLARGVLEIEWAAADRTEGSELSINGSKRLLVDEETLRYEVPSGETSISIIRPGFRTIDRVVDVSGRSTFDPKFRAAGETRVRLLVDQLRKRWNAIQGQPAFSPEMRRLRTELTAVAAFTQDPTTREVIRELRFKLPSELAGRLVSDTWTLGENWLRHSGTITAAQLVGRGSTLLSASTDGIIKCWDLRRGNLLQSLPVRPGCTNVVDVSADGNWVAAGGDDGVVRLWKRDDDELTELDWRHGKVATLAFSPDSKWLLSGGADNKARIWEVETAELTETFQMAHYVRGATWTQSGSHVAMGDSAGTVLIHSISDGEQRRLRGGPPVAKVHLDIERGYLEVIGANGRRGVWDLSSDSAEPARMTNAKRTYQLEPDGSRLEADGQLLQWTSRSSLDQAARPDVKIEPDRFSVATANAISTANFDPSRRWCVLGTNLGELAIVAADSGNVEYQCGPTNSALSCMGVSFDGSTLITGSKDGSVSLWDVFDRTETLSVDLHQSPVQHVAISRDHRHALSFDGSLLVITDLSQPESRITKRAGLPLRTTCVPVLNDSTTGLDDIDYQNHLIFREGDALEWRTWPQDENPTTLAENADDVLDVQFHSLFGRVALLRQIKDLLYLQYWDREKLIRQTEVPLSTNSRLTWIDEQALLIYDQRHACVFVPDSELQALLVPIELKRIAEDPVVGEMLRAHSGRVPFSWLKSWGVSPGLSRIRLGTDTHLLERSMPMHHRLLGVVDGSGAITITPDNLGSVN